MDEKRFEEAVKIRGRYDPIIYIHTVVIFLSSAWEVYQIAWVQVLSHINVENLTLCLVKADQLIKPVDSNIFYNPLANITVIQQLMTYLTIHFDTAAQYNMSTHDFTRYMTLLTSPEHF